MAEQKLLVVGLDCATPQLVFDRYLAVTPNLRRLMEEGAYGKLTSCIPCITVPAWSVMTSSKDPGVLGIYGFRNRADYSYDRLTIATGAAVKEPRVWDLLGRAGKQVVVVGVPGTFPPAPVNGSMVGCFLTPQTVARDQLGRAVTRPFTYPRELSEQVNDWAGGEYLVDVKDFRTDQKDALLRDMYGVTEQHFRVVKKMLRRHPWDFFMFVEIGVDRIHHAFWRFQDPSHPFYQPGNPFEDVIREYYRFIDQELSAVLSLLDDDTAVMVVSDHGAQSMQGGICVNDWLIREGLLTLAEDYPRTVTSPQKVKIDWSRTRAWGEGGYYARIFMNVAGREPNGIIPPQRYDAERDALSERIRAVRGPDGRELGTQVYKPQQIYRATNGVPPDLIVYWGDLAWRSVGSIGHPQDWVVENDIGPDDANHARDGIFIYWHPRRAMAGQGLVGLQIVDVAPTILNHFGLPVPGDMQGSPIIMV